MLDLNQVFVRKANTEEDVEKVFNVRWAGYKKYFNKKEEVIDEFDFVSNVTLLLATDAQEQVLGTMRILDGRCGEIQLNRYFAIDAILTEEDMPCAQANRFSIPNHPLSRPIKFALWKGFFRYCTRQNIQTMLISVRASAAREYQRLLLFEDVGPTGMYCHKEFGNLAHYTYKLNLKQASEKHKLQNRELYEFFWLAEHPNIQV